MKTIALVIFVTCLLLPPIITIIMELVYSYEDCKLYKNDYPIFLKDLFVVQDKDARLLFLEIFEFSCIPIVGLFTVYMIFGDEIKEWIKKLFIFKYISYFIKCIKYILNCLKYLFKCLLLPFKYVYNFFKYVIVNYIGNIRIG